VHGIHPWEEIMKAKFGIALAVGGFVLGAAAIESIHAQSKPPAYVIGQITVRDQEGYTKEFLPKARKGIEEAGGKYLAGGFNKTITLSGADPSNRVVLLQFESMDAVKAWNAKEGPFERSVGDKYATINTFAIEGMAP
jgi:uncharacterized protein (DUF1330 family)